MSRVTAFLGVVIFLSVLMTPTVTRATSYDVSATVPFPAPTIPATIDASILGQTVSSPVFRVFGTCEAIYPSTIISVFRSGSSIGSTSCAVDGKYQIDIPLNLGDNTIIVRSSSITNNYGPDSTSGVIRLVMPVATPTQQLEQQKASSDLSIATESPFVALTDTKKTAVVRVVVDGGDTPYTIQLNWGDGTVESRTVAVSGTYEFTHEYLRPGTYRAVAIVTDVKGVQREHYFAVVNAGPLSQDATKQDTAVVEEVCGAVSTDKNSELCNEPQPWYRKFILPIGMIALFVSGTALGSYVASHKRALKTQNAVAKGKKHGQKK